MSEPLLVPGELRGFRQFRLVEGRLLPVVHARGGAWAGTGERAVCAAGEEHDAPATGCACGLHAWWSPGDVGEGFGGVPAVVAASGRVVLADRGFRAARARVVAVALPPSLLLRPAASRRARDGLAAHYPGVRVYRTSRAMLRDHPPEDPTALGVVPLRPRRRRLLRAAFVLWLAGVLSAYALLVLPREAVRDAGQTWWPLLVAGLVAWQVALAVLVTRATDPTPREPVAG